MSALRDAIVGADMAVKSSNESSCWSRWAEVVRIVKYPRSASKLFSDAYITFNRTLTGYAKRDVRDKSLNFASCLEVMRKGIDELQGNVTTSDPVAFDAWHAGVCQALSNAWRGPPSLAIGQSQKWVNIYLKYLAALGSAGEHPWIRDRFASTLHVPIDNQVYRAWLLADDVYLDSGATVSTWFSALGLPAWSRITDRSQYMTLQRAFRDLSTRIRTYPLLIELQLWVPGA